MYRPSAPSLSPGQNRPDAFFLPWLRIRLTVTVNQLGLLAHGSKSIAAPFREVADRNKTVCFDRRH
jgi:hypothetical protein